VTADNRIARFDKLVQEYHHLAERRAQERTAQSKHFLTLCTRGRELIGQQLHALSLAIQKWREHFGPQVPTFDLFDILGISGKENRYTDLLAWLCARKDMGGESFVRQFLSRLHPAHLRPIEPGALLEVRRELVTDDGRIDLVLEFERCAIALEAKVWSSEHDTPGAQPQTVSYREALARKLELVGRPKPVLTVLLSPSGTPPLGVDAARLSFFDLAVAVLMTLDRSTSTDEQVILRLFAAHALDLTSWATAGHSFWDIDRALRLPHGEWPQWVTRDASALARLAATMEVHPQ